MWKQLQKLSGCHADDPGSIPGRGVFAIIACMEKKDSAMYSCTGGFGSGLLLDLRKSDLSAHPTIHHFQFSTLAKLRDGSHVQLGGFGRGLLLQASIMKLDLFAHS